MFLEDLNKLENVINVLCLKKEVPSVTSDGVRKRVIMEIDNFQNICKDYQFDKNLCLFPDKPFDEYTFEELRKAIFTTRNCAQELFDSKKLIAVDRGEVGLFIDFLDDCFSLYDLLAS